MNSFDQELQKKLLTTLTQKNIEFEVVFQGNAFPKKTNTLEDFLNVIKRLQTLDYNFINKGTETLDIFILNNNPIRVTLDKEQIIPFCKLNKLNESSITEILLKQNIKNETRLVNNQYNFVVNMKQEIPFDNIDFKKNINSEDYKNQFFNEHFSFIEKRFRHKKRYSFITKDGNFQIDLTIVRQSQGTSIYESNLFNKSKNYEIEIEYIGKKFTTSQSDNDRQSLIGKLMKLLKINITYILQVIQNSFYIISNSEKETVSTVFQSLLRSIYTKRKKTKINKLTEFLKWTRKQKNINFFEETTISKYFKSHKSPFYIQELYNNLKQINTRKKLSIEIICNKIESLIQYISNYSITKKKHSIGFKPNTLIMNNLHKEEEINILKNYTVTDKAEGEGKLLYILGSNHLSLENINNKQEIMNLVGKIYMIDKHSITYTGIKIDMNMKISNCIMNGEFMKLNKSKQYINRYLAYDLYYCNTVDYHEMPLLLIKGINCRIKKLNTIIKKIKSNKYFSITLKKFYIGNDIFKLSKKVLYDPNINYKLDGLIYTPAFSPVGYDEQNLYNSIDSIKINNYDLTFDRTWNSNLKWKDSSDNSIDFKIKYVQENNKDLILTNDQNQRYKTLHLYCGKFNEINKKYEEVLFIPTSPYDDTSYVVNVLINDNNIVMGEWDKFPIETNQVIEFSYDVDNRQWIPLRTRFDKTGTFGNDYFTANSIWKNMHMPITTDMITTGNNLLEWENVYFKTTNQINRNKSDILNLRNYHNKIKETQLKKIVSQLRSDNNTDIKLLELACGKGQDIHKWKQNKIEHIVGIDKMRDNIENPYNGAQTRYLNMNTKWTNDVTFLVGDCSKNIKNLDAFSNEHYKTMASKKLIGTFNLLSIQFAIHYFFENGEKIKMIIENIDEYLETNGYLIGCCFDGERIKQLLESIPINGNIKTKIWEIQKLFSVETNDEEYSPKKINVYIDSIGQNNMEYLVMFADLIELLKEKGIILQSLKTFEELGNEPQLKSYYNKMSHDEKTYSNLNNYFVFQKQTIQYSSDSEEESINETVSNESIETVQSSTSSTYEKLIIKIRDCMNLCYDIFEEYKLYLVGARIQDNNKKRMRVWNDFKPYLESLENVRNCIKDIKQYQDKKQEYKLLDYDYQLIKQYEIFLEQIELIQTKKQDSKIHINVRKENRYMLKTQEIQLLTNLLIECYEDFKNNEYNYKTIQQSKYYIASKIKYIHDFNKLFSKPIKEQLKLKNINLKEVVSTYNTFKKITIQYKLNSNISLSIKHDKTYLQAIKYIDSVFVKYKEQRTQNIPIKKTNAYMEIDLLKKIIQFLTNVEKGNITLDNENLINQSKIKSYQDLFMELVN